MDPRDLIIECDNFQSLQRQSIARKLKKYQFCLLRGLISKTQLSAGMRRLQKYIEENEDRACTGEAASEVRDYFMKMSIGLGNHSGHIINRSRFMRTVYIPLDKPDKFNLTESFRTVAKVRNLLMGKDINFAIDSPDENLWTAARVHHFPRGGGHMVPHRDTIAPQLLKDVNQTYEYFQPILIMSQKGRDFKTGGGLAMVDDNLIEYEDFSDFGDIAIYNVQTVHGVNEVDLNLPFKQRSSDGRYSGLVTLYKTQTPAEPSK